MLSKQRSRSKIKKSKHKTGDEKKYLQKVADLGCIICGSPANIHHIRTGQGLGQRSSHYATLPLCHAHHQGKEGIHTLGTKVWQAKFGSELELIEQVKKRIS